MNGDDKPGNAKRDIEAARKLIYARHRKAIENMMRGYADGHVPSLGDIAECRDAGAALNELVRDALGGMQ